MPLPALSCTIIQIFLFFYSSAQALEYPHYTFVQGDCIIGILLISHLIWMIDCLYGISTLHGSFNAEIDFVLKSRGVQWINGFGYFDHHLITVYDMNSSQLTDDEQLTADCFIMWTNYISWFPGWLRSTCSWKFSFIYLFASLPFSLLVNTWMVTLKISHLDITVGHKIPDSK